MPTEAQIRELAYRIWEQEGKPEGKDREHYFRAKQMLEAQEAGVGARPAPAPEGPGAGASIYTPPAASRPSRRSRQKK